MESINLSFFSDSQKVVENHLKIPAKTSPKLYITVKEQINKRERLINGKSFATAARNSYLNFPNFLRVF